MKTFTCYLYTFFAIFILSSSATAQVSILDPNDPIVNYDPQNPPALPSHQGDLVKWVRTPTLGWNTSDFKAYLYKGELSTVPFRLMFPKSYGTDPNKKYPLLLFFHGAGEKSPNGYYDNELQLLHCSRKIIDAAENGEFDGFILYPQSMARYWSSYTFPALKDIIEYMIQHNNVDQNRITIGGLSSGGSAVWDFIIQYPKLVAGATPISASGNWYETTSNVNALQSIPIWLSQGELDTHPYPDASEHLVSYFRGHGMDVRYTSYPQKAHDVWENHYMEPDAFSWMNEVNITNPHIYYGQTNYCSGQSFSDTLSITSGFDAYEWSRNGQIILGATSNKLITTDTGTYAARYQSNGEWSYWSPKPVTIAYQSSTQTPPITVKGLMSTVIPATDGKTSVTLQLPSGFTTYEWRDQTGKIVGTNPTYNVTQSGNYVATVTELSGCPANPSDSFYVAAADGPNPPSPATNLNGNTVSETSIQVYWEQAKIPSNDETAFEIYRRDEDVQNYSLVAIVPADTLHYTDRSLPPNKRYIYVVRAVNATAAASLSNEFQVSTTPDTQPPTAPNNLQILGSTHSSITLTWNVSEDNIGVTNYGIYINGIRSYITPENQITIHNLTKNQSYVFTVKAFDTSGNISAPSNQVIGSAIQNGLNYNVYYYTGSWDHLPNLNTLVPADSGFLPNISLDPAVQASNFAMSFNGYLNINRPGQYTFYTQSDDGSNLYINNTRVVNNDGQHGETEKSGQYNFDQPGSYPIRIDYFQNGGGKALKLLWAKSSPNGFAKSVIPDSAFTEMSQQDSSAPEAPSNVIAEALSYDSVRVDWKDNSSDEKAFEIYRSKYPTGPFNIIYTTKQDTVTYTDTIVAPSTTYYYQIKAVNNHGSSAFSTLTTSSQTTTANLPSPPIEPENLSAIALSPTKIKLEWIDAATNETSYELFRWIPSLDNYLKIATVDSNTNRYIDSMLTSNTEYNYKIRAVNDGGTSNFSSESIAKTSNYLPVLKTKDKYNIPTSSVSEIQIIATDQDDREIFLSLENLPVFATFTDNGDGSGILTLSPTADQIGNYTGIKALAGDPNGGKDSVTFTVSVVDAKPPVITQIDTIFANTFEFQSDTITLADEDSAENTNWTINNLPDFISTQASSNNKLLLQISPGEGDEGSYTFKVISSNQYDMTDSILVNIVVKSTPIKSWYINFASDASWLPFPQNPWNNIHSTTTTNLKDSQGNASQATLTLETDWWNPTTTGKQTGNNSGVYPDNVLRDNYYFGRGDGPNTVTGKLSQLDPSKSYVITFYSNSNWAFTNDNGHTVFQIGDQIDSIDVQGNTDRTISFTNVSPTSNGTIAFTMSKGTDAKAGYLNAMVVSTLASIPPEAPNEFSLENTTIDGRNAINVKWHLASNNANTIQVYRSNTKNGQYLLLNDNMQNGADQSYIDSTVAATSSETYYYYLVASNSFGNSQTTDTAAITTTQYIDTRQWYLNFGTNYSWLPLPTRPWNNILGTSASNLIDNQGNSSQVGLTLNTNWWNPTTTGAVTKNNSGVYPDNVLRDNYYFGRGGGPNSVQADITGLNPKKTYIITFFSNSNWSFTTDNGHTVFSIGDRIDSIYVQGNTNNTISFNNITPSEDGSIRFTMRKGSDAPAGYLNAIVISTQADIAPTTPSNIQLSKKIVDGKNAVKLSWTLTSNNATEVKIYRSTERNNNYTLVNDGITNGSKENYTDTTVNPTEGSTYYYYLFTSNASGESQPTDTVSITTDDYIDQRKWYLSFASDNDWMPFPAAPWNNIHNVVSNQLNDENGNSSMVGLTLNTDWWHPTSTGQQTGNNTGLYPDLVLRDNYYFGRGEGPNPVTGKITGLDPENSYLITFFASSNWAFTNDNGHTVFEVGSQIDSIDVQGNTNNSITFTNIVPDTEGNINFRMSKGTEAPAGYLNAIVISTQAREKPTSPIGMELSNKIVDGENAVLLKWKLTSNNANSIKIYRAGEKNGPYDLLNDGLSNGNTTQYTDTSVSPSNSTKYYYYLVASNTYGESASTDTVSITTSEYIDARDWYVNFATNNSWMSYPGIPWNNITNVTTDNLNDNQGQSSSVGLKLNTTWWNVTTNGTKTGDNSGIYPDDVLRDNYYFGRNGGPNEVSGDLTGLDTSKEFTITFFSSSTWAFTTDNGHTVIQVTDKKDSIDVQGNTNQTVSFADIKPDQLGRIHFTISKGADAKAGYLNAIVIHTQSDMVPQAPINFELNNSIAQNQNAVKISWQMGSNNTDSVQLFRSTQMSGPYDLISQGLSLLDSSSFTDTDVDPLNASKYYYYMIASNSFGNSTPTDTLSIITSTLYPTAPLNLRINPKVIGDQYIAQLSWNKLSPYVKSVNIYRANNGNSSYSKITTITVNGSTITYNDVNVGLGNEYSYYITSQNEFGTSSPSDTVSIQMPENSPPPPPILKGLSETYVGADTTTSISIGIEASGETVTFALNNEPKFINIQNTGNYTANLIIAPDLADTGDYENIQVVATNTAGASDTISFNLHVINRSLLPTTPKGFTLSRIVANNRYVSELNWNLDSGNNKEIVIYRSSTENGQYDTVASISTNSVPVRYIDTNIDLGNAYYYYLVGKNDYGISTATATLSIEIPSIPLVPPVLSDIPETYVAAGNSETLQITASPSNSGVTFAVLNDIPFITIHSEDDHEARLLIHPGKSDIGNYDSVAIVATKAEGSTDTAYFSLHITDGNLLPAIYLNFTNARNNVSAPWNNIEFRSLTNISYNNLINEANQNTGIKMTIVNPWTGVQTNGANTYNNTGFAPDSVMSTGYYITNSNTQTLQISGLDPNRKYNIVFFGSSDEGGTTNYTTNYSVGQQTVALNGILNARKSVRINGLQPGENRTITIEIEKQSNAARGLLNAIVIEPYATNGLVAPGNLEAIADNNTVKLSWIDRTNNETQFQVLRADAIDGVYTQIGQTSTNSEGYIDHSVSSNTRYFYKIVATGEDGNGIPSDIATVTTPAYEVRVNFNFNGTPAPSPWNNTQTSPQQDDIYGPLRDTQGQNTGIKLNMQSNFEAVGSSGFNTGNNSGIYPDAVLRTSYYSTNEPDTVIMTISNLNIAKTYDLKFYGSLLNQGWKARTQYLVNGRIASLQTAFNEDNLATLNDITPDQIGQITVKITKAPSATVSAINALIIQSHDGYDDQGNPIVDSSLYMRVIDGNNTTQPDKLPDDKNPDDFALIGSVYPNPFDQLLNIKINSPSTGKVLLTLFDVNGHLADRSIKSVLKGANHFEYYPVQTLQPGVYILKLQLMNTDKTFSVKLIRL